VEVCNPSKVQVFGPAVEGSVPLEEPTYFVVDCSDAGPGTSVPAALSVYQFISMYRHLNPSDAICDLHYHKRYSVTLLNSYAFSIIGRCLESYVMISLMDHEL